MAQQRGLCFGLIAFVSKIPVHELMVHACNKLQKAQR
jgi:hypothetical protein